jgi:hypothetical protein
MSMAAGDYGFRLTWKMLAGPLPVGVLHIKSLEKAIPSS